MRLSLASVSVLARFLSASALLAIAACAPGEASPSPGSQNGAQLKLVRGYTCTQGSLVGRYSCARTLDRRAQREAAAAAAGSCRSCAPARAR